MTGGPTRIALCLKATPSPVDVSELAITRQLRVDASGRALRLGYVEIGVNGFDEQALGTVVTLARGGLECAITAITVDAADEDALFQRAFELGVDEGIAVRSGDAEPSALTVARLLAAAIERDAADLVVLGDASSDLAGGVMGALVAALLDRPYLYAVHDLRVTDGVATAVRSTPSGAVETVEASLPVVVGICDDGWEPVRPRALDVLAARSRRASVLASDAVLGPDRASAAGPTRTGLEIDELAHTCTFLDAGSPTDVAAELLRELRGVER